MPELPEVQTIAADLDELVGGSIIEAVAVNYPKIVAGEVDHFIRLVSGAEINKIERFGKWIRFLLTGPAGPAAMLVHLKMTGQFELGSWPEPGAWPAHAHAAFRLAGRPAGQDTLFYRDIRKFGRLRAFDEGELAEFLGHLGLGPDPLTVEPEEFFQRLTARKGRLKCVLLDQTTVAGLGNIYVDEGLFAAKLSPLRSAATLSRAETDRLLAETQRILKASIKARGSTTSNYQGLKGGGGFQHSHQAYGRTGQPCSHCGSPLERCLVGGRATHYCPQCQPIPVKS
jgi:formamidopyrimidine-DNA glycosylase (fpg)